MKDFFIEPYFTQFFGLLITIGFTVLGWVIHENTLREDIKILEEDNRQLRDLENNVIDKQTLV